MGKFSVYGYDPFYDFDGDGKLGALEAGFQLHGERMEEEAIRNNRPLDYFSMPSTHESLCDDWDDDLDDDF